MSDWFENDDSDFMLSDSDSDSEDEVSYSDYPCNTMLITGPYGIGKTSMVHALAQELGYQVNIFYIYLCCKSLFQDECFKNFPGVYPKI